MENEENTHGGVRTGAGRPKGAKNIEPAKGRKTQSLVISCKPEQIAKIKELAAQEQKTVSAYILDLIGV